MREEAWPLRSRVHKRHATHMPQEVAWYSSAGATVARTHRARLQPTMELTWSASAA